MQFDFNPFIGQLDIVDKPLQYRYWRDSNGVLWRSYITTGGNLYTEVVSSVSNGLLAENNTDLELLESSDFLLQEA